MPNTVSKLKHNLRQFFLPLPSPPSPRRRLGNWVEIKIANNILKPDQNNRQETFNAKGSGNNGNETFSSFIHFGFSAGGGCGPNAHLRQLQQTTTCHNKVSHKIRCSTNENRPLSRKAIWFWSLFFCFRSVSFCFLFASFLFAVSVLLPLLSACSFGTQVVHARCRRRLSTVRHAARARWLRSYSNEMFAPAITSSAWTTAFFFDVSLFRSFLSLCIFSFIFCVDCAQKCGNFVCRKPRKFMKIIVATSSLLSFHLFTFARRWR